MKSFKKFVFALGLVLTVVSASALPVYAATASTDSTTCSVKAVGAKNTTGAADSRWTVTTDGVASAKVVATGDPTCMQQVTISVWQAPDAVKGLPYSAQKLVAHTTYTVPVGTTPVSIVLPDCFYQVDLVRGADAIGTNGQPIFPAGTNMASLHGGTKACETGGTGGATTPTPTPTPVTPVAEVTPTELPSVGTGSTVIVAALAAVVGGTIFQYVRQMRRI
jgi:hypothetical protein